MIATLEKPLTVSEMMEDPAKWERFELYHGEPLEMGYTKPIHGKTLLSLGTIIQNWIHSSGYGEITGGETGIHLDEYTRYCFDLGWSDVPLVEDEILTKSLPLMVEIVSDSNDAEKLLIKVQDYLKYGAKEVWVVYPKQKTIQVYYPNNTARLFHEEDTITPGDWMKGFSLPLKELWSEKTKSSK